MLRRRRGGQKSSRKMAKKTAPAALQIEISNNDNWNKMLKSKGLIVVDVYSEWSGPCTGMTSILKKVKMEIGGDSLNYAVAKCDYISDLERFQGKSEPTWMFIRDGKMVNLMFGANCPKFLEMLTTELHKMKNGEEPEFVLDVFERSHEENIRLKNNEEARIAKETAKRLQKEADTKARYEAELSHLISSLKDETCLVLYPWVFKDEEGRRRDKKSSPPYVELTEEVLPGKYTIQQEVRKQLTENIVDKLFVEENYALSESARRLILDGKCMFMRLKICDNQPDVDIHKNLIYLLFERSEFPQPNETLPEECFAGRHHATSTPSGTEHEGISPIVWTPPNAINKALVFRTFFNAYVLSTYPYQDKSSKPPMIVFKYDNTKKNDLKVLMDMFSDDVIEFGIFEYDKPPDAKMLSASIAAFEESNEEKTGYEIFVCGVKKVGCEAFLAFAGIGPYHVSENPEKATEELKLYFSNISATATVTDEIQSDDEEKPETPENDTESPDAAPVP